MSKKNSNLKELFFMVFLSILIIFFLFYYFMELTKPEKSLFSGDINIQIQELEKLLRDDLKIYSEGFDSGGNSFSFYVFEKNESGFDPLISFIEYNVVEESFLIRKKDGKRTHEFRDVRNIGCSFFEGLFKVVFGNEEQIVDVLIIPVSEYLKVK